MSVFVKASHRARAYVRSGGNPTFKQITNGFKRKARIAGTLTVYSFKDTLLIRR